MKRKMGLKRLFISVLTAGMLLVFFSSQGLALPILPSPADSYAHAWARISEISVTNAAFNSWIDPDDTIMEVWAKDFKQPGSGNYDSAYFDETDRSPLIVTSTNGYMHAQATAEVNVDGSAPLLRADTTVGPNAWAQPMSYATTHLLATYIPEISETLFTLSLTDYSVGLELMAGSFPDNYALGRARIAATIYLDSAVNGMGDDRFIARKVLTTRTFEGVIDQDSDPAFDIYLDLSGADLNDDSILYVDLVATSYAEAIPEPGTLLLVGFGLIGILGIARYKNT